MNKYKVVCTIWKLPKHQRRKISGKPVSKTVLGKNLIKEKFIYITSAELDESWDQLAELYRRGEAEVRNPDGTIFRFTTVKEEPKAPPEEKIEKLPPSQPLPSYNTDVDIDIGSIAPVDNGKPKKKGKKKKKKKREEEKVEDENE